MIALEFGVTQAIGVRAPVESQGSGTSTLFIGDSRLPLEYGQQSFRSARLGLEKLIRLVDDDALAGTTLTNDGGSNQLTNDISSGHLTSSGAVPRGLPIEGPGNTQSITSVTRPNLEWMGAGVTLTSDRFLNIEWSDSLRSGSWVALENVRLRSADVFFGLEDSRSVSRGHNVYDESGDVVLRPVRTLTENLVTRRGDNDVRFEMTRTQRGAAPSPIESAATFTVTSDRLLPLEVLGGAAIVLMTRGLPLEFLRLSAVIRDSFLPIEFTGAFSVSSSSIARLESTTALLLSRGLPMSFDRRAINDVLVSVENVNVMFAERRAVGGIEILAPTRSDVFVRLEEIVRAERAQIVPFAHEWGMRADANILMEGIAFRLIPVTTSIPLEALGAPGVIARSGMRLEFVLRAVRSALIHAEKLSSPDIVVPTRVESIKIARPVDINVLFEFLGGKTLTSAGFSLLEWLISSGRSQRVPVMSETREIRAHPLNVETVLGTITLSADTVAWIEARTSAALPEIASGRLLASPGKIRGLAHPESTRPERGA